MNVFLNKIETTKPICAFFCISAGANFNKQFITESITYLLKNKILTIYVITNMYNLGNSSEKIKTEMFEIARTLTGKEVEFCNDYWKFDNIFFGLMINSINYTNLVLEITRPLKNIDVLMNLCLENCEPSKIIDFFFVVNIL